MRPEPSERSEPCDYPILHRYTEASARAKIARHRARGDTMVMTIGCPGTDHWHVLRTDCPTCGADISDPQEQLRHLFDFLDWEDPPHRRRS